MGSGRKTRVRKLTAGSLTLLYTCFLAAPLYLLWQELRLHAEIDTYLDAESQSVIYRSLLEVNAVELALTRALDAPSPETVAALQTSVDIVYGRGETLHGLGVNAILSDLAGFSDTDRALIDLVEAGDRAVAILSGAGPAYPVVADLERALAAAQERVQSLLHEHILESSKLRDSVRDEAEKLDAWPRRRSWRCCWRAPSTSAACWSSTRGCAGPAQGCP